MSTVTVTLTERQRGLIEVALESAAAACSGFSGTSDLGAEYLDALRVVRTAKAAR